MIHPIEFNPDSTASNPGGLALSERKLRVLEPSMSGWRRVVRKVIGMLLIVDVLDMIDRKVLSEHLAKGDARAAVVVSTAPLLVAAYSDDLECVAMLRFPAKFVDQYSLRLGSQLVTVNTYYSQFANHADLTFGPGHVDDWSGFFPLIAEFLSDDSFRIEYLTEDIDKTEWDRCRQLGEAYLLERPRVARLGRPRRAHQPAGFMKKIVIGVSVSVVAMVAFIVVAWKFL